MLVGMSRISCGVQGVQHAVMAVARQAGAKPYESCRATRLRQMSILSAVLRYSRAARRAHAPAPAPAHACAAHCYAALQACYSTSCRHALMHILSLLYLWHVGWHNAAAVCRCIA